MKNYRIIKFEKPVTVEEALNWVKECCGEANFEKLNGRVNIGKACHCGGLSNYMKYINRQPSKISNFKKIYRNTTADFDRQRFATHLISYYVIAWNDELGLNFNDLYDDWGYENHFKPMIENVKKYNPEVIIEMFSKEVI